MKQFTFRKVLTFVLACLTMQLAYGQQPQKVIGKITDESGEPMIGVSIHEYGTDNGAFSFYKYG